MTSNYNKIEFTNTMKTRTTNELNEVTYEAICKKQKNVFEIIPDDKQVKFYFDTDHVFYEDFDKFDIRNAERILTILMLLKI